MEELETQEDQTKSETSERRRFLAKALGVLAGTSLIGGVAKAFAQVGQKTVASNGGQKQVAGEYPFIGEIMMFAGNFAPTGYAACDGSLLPISSYAALFSVIGTYYGGNGTTNFALPDLRGRVPIHVGTGAGLSTYSQGQMGGQETHTLLATEMPAHNHTAYASTSGGTSSSPSNNFPAVNSEGIEHYGSSENGTMNANAIGAAGGSQPHNNIQPYLAINFCIAISGIFPSRS
jgi:microcystin-dependent protein